MHDTMSLGTGVAEGSVRMGCNMFVQSVQIVEERFAEQLRHPAGALRAEVRIVTGGERRVGLEPHPGRNRAVGIGLAAVLTAIGGMDDKMQPPLLMFRMSIVFGNPKLPW